MSRFFTAYALTGRKTAELTGEDAHHVSRSLRMAVGDSLTVCGSDGCAYACTITGFNEDKTVFLSVPDEPLPSAEPPYDVHLFQGLPKGDKTESIIQKAVEGGVTDITLFTSANCVMQIKADAEGRKEERRKKIAYEAAVQSGRNVIPALHPSAPFSKILPRAAEYDLALFCYEGKGTVGIGSVLKNCGKTDEQLKIAVAVGPEGGFSLQEAAAAVEAGWQPVGLGPRILRTETAGIFVLGALSAFFETT